MDLNQKHSWPDGHGGNSGVSPLPLIPACRISRPVEPQFAQTVHTKHSTRSGNLCFPVARSIVPSRLALMRPPLSGFAYFTGKVSKKFFYYFLNNQYFSVFKAVKRKKCHNTPVHMRRSRICVYICILKTCLHIVFPPGNQGYVTSGRVLEHDDGLSYLITRKNLLVSSLALTNIQICIFLKQDKSLYCRRMNS